MTSQHYARTIAVESGPGGHIPSYNILEGEKCISIIQNMISINKQYNWPCQDTSSFQYTGSNIQIQSDLKT